MDNSMMRKLSDIIKKVLEPLDHGQSIAGKDHGSSSDSSINHNTTIHDSGDCGKVRKCK